MDPIQLKIQELEDIVAKLQGQVADLTGQVTKNNFSAEQIFIKRSTFNHALNVPSGLSTNARVGDIAQSGGVLYICTVAPNTWTVVGTQS